MKIAFICSANMARSQMAEGYARHFASLKRPDIEIYSAGSNPGQRVHPLAIEVMKEEGIDISSHYPKGIESLPKDLDLVVTVCSGLCPDVKGARSIHWEIPDPAGGDINLFREIREQIKTLVKELIESL